jgi:DNA-binding MarR family transcriptional regulator
MRHRWVFWQAFLEWVYHRAMFKPSPYSSTYLNFLNLVQAVRALPDFPVLDPVEERMLNVLATVWHAGKQITVLQAMGMSTDVSSTTAHRRLKSLRKKGVIVLVSDEADNRIKYVQPTSVADQYFSRLGQCLGQAHAV